MIAAPSLLLIAVLVWKTLFDHQAIIHSSVLSWLVMFMVSGLWWLWLLCITLNATRLDREGIAINILHHYIDTLKETLIADADTLTDENADYCVAIGTTTLLPERFAEYVKNHQPYSVSLLSAAPGLTRGQYVEFYDASASTAVSWRIYVYRPGYL
ncbi:hypothetical protein LNO36_18475 [Klebsiella variicola subsp. variicola]|nr:hypothetical protein [Klebsiella variicola subsp. variicola]